MGAFHGRFSWSAYGNGICLDYRRIIVQENPKPPDGPVPEFEPTPRPPGLGFGFPEDFCVVPCEEERSITLVVGGQRIKVRGMVGHYPSSNALAVGTLTVAAPGWDLRGCFSAPHLAPIDYFCGE
ncbi:MAG: hypothetical protein EXR72_18270 [Myxococcales bacterium]|nr:hypothetical protein [Myxococcales bacterium]